MSLDLSSLELQSTLAQCGCDIKATQSCSYNIVEHDLMMILYLGYRDVIPRVNTRLERVNEDAEDQVMAVTFL